MQEVTLYTLNAQKVISYDSRTIDWSTMHLPDTHIKVLPGAVITARYEIEHLPVHWFSERYADGDQHDYRFAIEPKLMNLLESIAEKKFNNQINQLSTTNRTLVDIARKYQQQVNDFIEKPWYKRIWSAIKNNI